MNKEITTATSYQQILDIAVQHSAIYDSVNTATSLHRIAKQHPTEADMQVRLRAARNTSLQACDGDCAHTQVFGVQVILSHPGFQKLSALASTQLHMCRAQQLANIIWAFATLGYQPPLAFMEALAEEAVRKRSGFNPQNVANMLWAFAKLEYTPQCRLVGTLAEEGMKKLPDFVSQNVSNMLWAFAKLDFDPGPSLLKASVNKIMAGISTFNPQVGFA